MGNRLSDHRIPPFVWCLVLAAYLLPLAFPVALMEDDEGLHAAVAQEMVDRGDWIVPRLAGEPFLDKPILYFWIEATSIAALGSSEFAVRLPGVLLAIAAVAAIAWLATALFGASVGRWAALCYATMLLPYGVSLVPVHDLVMVPLVVIAIGSFWHARHTQSVAALAGWTLVAGLTLGLSLLGKGLTGVGLVGVAVIAWLLWTRGLTWRLIAAACAALVVAAAIALPWYLAMAHAVPGYLSYYFIQRHLEAVVGSTQPHAGRPVWYYLPLLVAGSWPWILLVLKRIQRPLTDAERLLWCWLVADVTVLSLAGSKLVTYILPAMPAVAGLAAMSVIHDSRTLQRVARWGAIAGALLPIAAVVYFTRRFHIQAWPVTGLIVASAPIAALLWTLTRWQPRSWSAAPRLAMVAAVTILATALAVRPIAASGLTARELADYFNRADTLPRRLLIVDEGTGSFMFYLRPELRRQIVADSVQKIPRLSLADIQDTDGVVVAIAARRIDAVAESYEFPETNRTPGGGFLVLPLAALIPRDR